MRVATSLSRLPSEVESFAFSFGLGFELLMQGRPCSQHVVGSFRRLLNNVCGSGDLLGFIDACSLVRSGLVSSGSWDANPSKGERRRWVRGLCSAVECAIPGSLIVHPSAEFNAVATFLGWLKRLPVCIRPEHESVDAYYASDRRISRLDFGSIEWVPMLRDIWVEWFGSFRITRPFLARHGSGSTADAGRIRHDKWRSLSIDPVGHVCMRDASLEHIHDLDLGAPLRCSKVVFVPKQAGKDRTICMEPAWLQYLQQGVAAQLVAFTHDFRHPLNMLVNIFSQERNRELCAWAVDRGLATIDLSDASDSVSWSLIRELTKGLPIARYLFGTRSTSTVLDGRVVRMSKFAPMGSALCFPIECFVFASIVELAHRIHYGRASRGHLSGCSVYGDDIICPSEIYHLVVDILTSLGFVVNESKSFSSGSYRESCGVEYSHGALITTVKHPRSHLLCQEVVSPEWIGLVSDLANSLYMAGYFRCRRQLLRYFSEKRVRVGSRLALFMDLMVFDGEHCFPVGQPYARTTFDRLIQRSVERLWSCDARVGRAGSDYVDYQSTNVRRDRSVRISDLVHTATKRCVDPKWSRTAVVALAKYGHWDLLAGDDVQVVGQRRTGRLRYTLRRRIRPV